MRSQNRISSTPDFAVKNIPYFFSIEKKSGVRSYRYAFNGMEKDDEWKGSGNSLDFGARVYDPRLGKWLSSDPLARKYPMDSPYMFAGNSPMIVIDPDGNEKIIITGSENRSWKLTFALPAMKLLKHTTSLNDREGTALLLFTAGYSQKQRDRIKKYAQKKGASYVEVNSADDVVGYLNNKSTTGDPNGRDKDPVTQVTIFSHGLPNQIAFGYGQGGTTEDNYAFDASDVNKLDPNAFAEGAYCYSYACRTGAANYSNGDVDPEKSLAQNLADKTGITVYALQKRSDYAGILPPDNRSTWQKIKEYIGYEDGDQTYDQNAGSWDTDGAIDKTSLPSEGSTPSSSPGWTKFEKGKTPTKL